ncbi:MAG TPA: bifunctional hydroxymethylpyrimidine kinase/phosphomethylpyrimidine kinase [Alphaproteobacteria bacterium]|nr:bifunctional hydroxymethylpyrimidine kinase/phosphomethylpyrimidine kinase [Alphaproteobacteria bacterium]
MKGRVLIVAGSDSGGGAGIQADIKTVTALDGYAATAITALTAQNTQGVFGVFPVKAEFVRKQVDLVLEDIGADAVKTGMLYDESIVNALADALEAYGKPIKLVVDPVMLAKGGAPLIDPNAVAALKRRIINLATIITPNLLEAEKLAGTTIRTVDDMEHAAASLLTLGCEAALITGGHLESQMLTDVLATSRGVQRFRSERIATKHTHGTGCTLASAIATSLAQGLQIEEAVERARAYVRRAIETAPNYGRGHGPVNHAHPVEFAMGLAAANPARAGTAKAPRKKPRRVAKRAPKRKAKSRRKRA